MTSEELIDDRLMFLYGPDAPPEPEIEKPEQPHNEDTEQPDPRRKEYYEYLSSWGRGNEMLRKAGWIRDHSVHLSVSSLVTELVTLSGISDLVRLWDNPVQRKSNLEAIKKLAADYESRCLVMNMGASDRSCGSFPGQDHHPAALAVRFHLRKGA